MVKTQSTSYSTPPLFLSKNQIFLRVSLIDINLKTYIAMSFAGSCKLQLSKGICWWFWWVSDSVPTVHHGGAEMVSDGLRGMFFFWFPALTHFTITDRRWENNTPLESENAPTTTLVYFKAMKQSAPYLTESSTKVEQTLFLMILGIQLWGKK